MDVLLLTCIPVLNGYHLLVWLFSYIFSTAGTFVVLDSVPLFRTVQVSKEKIFLITNFKHWFSQILMYYNKV